MEVDTLTHTPTNRRFLVKEVGGNLATTWPHYYQSTTPPPALILYTIHTAHPHTLSASLIHLLALLHHLQQSHSTTRLLLLYTQGADSGGLAGGGGGGVSVESVCRFGGVVGGHVRASGMGVGQVRCSGLTGEGCDVVLREMLGMLRHATADAASSVVDKR